MDESVNQLANLLFERVMSDINADDEEVKQAIVIERKRELYYATGYAMDEDETKFDDFLLSTTDERMKTFVEAVSGAMTDGE